MSKQFVSEGALATAPPLPESNNRPPTKQEMWAYVSHVYGELWGPDELKAYARDRWVGAYVYWVNIKAWRKHPDWVEGQPVIAAACPPGPFFADTPYTREIQRLWEVAQEALKDQSQLTLEAA